MDTIDTLKWMPIVGSLLRRGCSDAEISSQLLANGAPENRLQDIIASLKNIRNQQKRKAGFTWCGIGVVLLVLGCMLTIVLYQNGSGIRFAMYGLTTIGVVFTLIGLAGIIGW
jgi:Flp pilus assembly protein TadB